MVSPLIFTHKVSGEVMAVVQIDPNNPDIHVNTRSITMSMLFLLPAYHALNEEQRNDFLSRSHQIVHYIAFEEAIETLLKGKKSVYSEEDSFISLAIALNGAIVEAYPNLNSQAGNRVSNSQEIFSNWITRDNGASIVNQVRSHVHVQFDPIASGAGVSKLIDPRPFVTSASVIPLSQFSISDNCYKVKISQSNSQAFNENSLEVAKSAVSMLFSFLFGKTPNDNNDCIGKIAGGFQSSINSIIMNLASSSQSNSVFSVIIKEAGSYILNNATTFTLCKQIFTSKEVLFKAISKNTLITTKVIDGILLTTTGAQAVPFIIALIDGVELEETIQIYDGKLKEACIEIVKDNILKQEYFGEEEVIVKVKLIPKIGPYADWIKSGFRISWKLAPLNGTVNPVEINTDSNGLATVTWTLPNEDNAVVTLTAELKDREGDHLSGSPLNFQVKVLDKNKFIDPRDGNVYRIVTIGNQTWFAENLRYAGSIANVAIDSEWSAIWNEGNPTRRPAWAYFNNNPANDATYGKLYNWYAVNTGGLCPPGWHIPSDAEWTVLINYLGGFEAAAGKMKSTTTWDSPNTGATNASGFSGLAGGFRFPSSADFRGRGRQGIWWSATQYDATHSWSYVLYNSLSFVGRWSDYSQAHGFSCRCIKD